MSQAGKIAARPKNQWCCGRQLDTHLLRYGTTAPVANNPRTPRIMENLVISSSNRRALRVLAWEARIGCRSGQRTSGSP